MKNLISLTCGDKNLAKGRAEAARKFGSLGVEPKYRLHNDNNSGSCGCHSHDPGIHVSHSKSATTEDETIIKKAKELGLRVENLLVA